MTDIDATARDDVNRDAIAYGAGLHICGYPVASHGRRLPAGLWEHPCEQIAAIDARVKKTWPTWRDRVRRLVSRPRVRAEKENDEQ